MTEDIAHKQRAVFLWIIQHLQDIFTKNDCMLDCLESADGQIAMSLYCMTSATIWDNVVICDWRWKDAADFIEKQTSFLSMFCCCMKYILFITGIPDNSFCHIEALNKMTSIDEMLLYIDTQT